MNTTANFDAYATPFAFGPKRKKFLDIMLRDGKKIISQGFGRFEPLERRKFNKNLISILFNVKINGNFPQHMVCLRDILRKIILNISNGHSYCSAVNQVLQETE